MCLHKGLSGITECGPVQVGGKKSASGELFSKTLPAQRDQQPTALRVDIGVEAPNRGSRCKSSLNIISLRFSPYRNCTELQPIMKPSHQARNYASDSSSPKCFRERNLRHSHKICLTGKEVMHSLDVSKHHEGYLTKCIKFQFEPVV